MDKKEEIIEIYTNEYICGAISHYLKSNKKTYLCNVIESDKKNIIILRSKGHEKTYTAPIRLGEILDQLIYYKENAINNDNTLIDFNGSTLDTNQGIFTTKSNEKISLTEKEVEILSFLHSNKGNITSRKQLLKKIWNYVEDIETHTLETHIYRLRQKIEENPANPLILVTKEDGYSV